MAHLLEVKDLQVRFRTEGATVHAVNGISYALMTLIHNPSPRAERGQVC